MATSSLAMSDYLPSTARQPSFLRRLLMLLVFTAGIVIWMSLLQRFQKQIPNFWMTIFADAAVALAAGLGARLLFYQRSSLIRFITAFGMLFAGLYALGFLTNWQSGIGPAEQWQHRLESLEIAEMIGGLGIVLLSLQAWWKSEASDVEPLAEPVAEIRQERRSRRSRTPKLPAFSLPSVGTSRSTSTSSRSRRNGRLKVRRSTHSRSQRTRPDPDRVVIGRPAKSTSSRRNKLFRQKPELQLSSYEEHRCPYCLDEVRRNDPRGVKECSICHTLHHADCWNVTGMCQIPHQNTLDL